MLQVLIDDHQPPARLHAAQRALGDGQLLRRQPAEAPLPSESAQAVAPREPRPIAPLRGARPLAPVPLPDPRHGAPATTTPAPTEPAPADSVPVGPVPLRLCGVGLRSALLETAARSKRLAVEAVAEIEQADALLALRGELGRDPGLRRRAQALGLPILVIKSDSLHQLQRAMERLLERRGAAQPTGRSHPGALERAGAPRPDPAWSAPFSSSFSAVAAASEGAAVPPAADESHEHPDPQRRLEDAHAALEECRLAVERVVLPLGQPVELLPRSEEVRRMQAQLIARYRLRSAVFGRGVQQRLRVFPA